MNNNRRRGITVYRMPEKVNGPNFDTYALMIRPNGDMRMVHNEGVQYNVTENAPWCWTDYDASQKHYSPNELKRFVSEENAIDLADWIRSFGARLENNFELCVAWYEGKF